MKKILKISIAFIAIICLISALSGCAEEEKAVYFYGVTTFKTVGSENGVFAFVPIDTCGDVRIYEQYTTLPEDLSDGDVIKMKFNSAPEIRTASVDDVPFLAFWPVPQEITIISKNVSMIQAGSDYSLTIPNDIIENIAADCGKINACDENGKCLYTFDKVSVGDEKTALNVPVKDGHKALYMLQYRLVAEKG